MNDEEAEIKRVSDAVQREVKEMEEKSERLERTIRDAAPDERSGHEDASPPSPPARDG